MQRAKLLRRNSQSFYWDFIIGVLIFTMVIVLFLKYNTIFESKEDSITNLINEAKIVSEILMTQGYPYNWEAGNVEKVGIINSEARIDNNKLEAFANLSHENYDNSRFLFGINYDFIVFFEDKNNNIIPITTHNSTVAAIGKSGVDSANIGAVEDIKNLVKIERHIIYDSKIARMTVYVWSVR